MHRFTTRQDAIEQHIAPALGEWGDDYDLDSIFDACFVYRTDTDERGNEVLTHAGFERAVTDDQFWDAVKDAERH